VVVKVLARVELTTVIRVLKPQNLACSLNIDPVLIRHLEIKVELERRKLCLKVLDGNVGINIHIAFDLS